MKNPEVILTTILYQGVLTKTCLMMTSAKDIVECNTVRLATRSWHHMQSTFAIYFC